MVAGGHPGREREADAAPLRQPGHHAAGDPVAAQAPDGPDQRVAVRREGERPIDDAAEPDRLHRRVVLERDRKLGRDAIDVVLEELRTEVPGRLAWGPRHACLLVRAHQHRAAFLADVDLAGEVERHRHLVTGLRDVVGDLLHVLGDQVVVLHREHGQLDPDHPADLARPQPTGVDDVLGVDRLAVLEADIPGRVGSLREPDDRRVLMDLGAELLSTLDVRAGDAGRVDVALDRVVQRPDEVLRVHEREQLGRFLRGDELQLHAEVPAARLGHPQEVHADLRVGEHQAARQVDRTVLAGLPLDLLVQLDRVLLESGDVRDRR